MSLIRYSPAVAQAKPVLLCLSHLRWKSVVQRPHHLMRHAAARYHVLFWEEPMVVPPEPGLPRVVQCRTPDGIVVATPWIAAGTDRATAQAQQRQLLDALLADAGGTVAVAWFYTPMMLPVAAHVPADVTVHDCMDELSGFLGASPQLLLLERRLLKRSDLVFTGGRSLHAAKRSLHGAVHLFPSSVDAAHFGRAETESATPADQAGIPGPRIGFHGVIDERMDLPLLEGVAAARPDWQFVMVGPIVKIDPASVPRRSNIHWLGPKPYAELPSYLAGWDAGFMPFALNEATRYISPTKTPEFLAAGLPVVSTPVADVVHDYGRDGLVEIAADADAMVAALMHAMTRPKARWQARVTERLRSMSWIATWAQMERLIADASAATKPAELGSGGGG